MEDPTPQSTAKGTYHQSAVRFFLKKDGEFHRSYAAHFFKVIDLGSLFTADDDDLLVIN